MKLKIINSGSKGNCYVLESSTDEILLIECGVKFSEIKECLNFNIDKISGCLLSHLHGDHSKSIKHIINAGIDVFGSQITFNALKLENHRLYPVEPKTPFKIGSFDVISFDAIHDVPTLGFLIKHKEMGTCLFLTDSSYVAYKFPGLNQIMIEANYCLDKIQQKRYDDNMLGFLHDRIIMNHLSIQTAMEILNVNDLTKVNNIVLIHLSDSNSDAKEFKQKVSDATGKNVVIAKKNVCINFNQIPF